MQKTFIHLGCDHGGFELKNSLSQWLENLGYDTLDHGAYTLDPTDDYPQFAFKLAQAVVDCAGQDSNQRHLGVLLCRSGAGMAVAANKVVGARAVVLDSERAARRAIVDDHANIVTLQAEWTTLSEAQQLLQTVLATQESKEPRHVRRVAAITQYEQKALA